MTLKSYIKYLVIMRGVPGSGKSRYATRLVDRFMRTFNALSDKYSADDYFIGDDGVYRFDRDKLGAAHFRCRDLTEKAMNDGYPLVVIDNTNTMLKEMNPYIKMAKRHGYRVIFRTIGDLAKESLEKYAARNTHGVPLEAIRRMAGRFQPDPIVKQAT